jgi:hypothetical protein
MYKHFSFAAFKIKLTTGSGNAASVKNSTAGAGSNSGKKAACVQAPLRPEQVYTGNVTRHHRRAFPF